MTWTWCMPEEQWILGFIWPKKIMVSQYQPRAMIFVITWYNLISLRSHCLLSTWPLPLRGLQIWRSKYRFTNLVPILFWVADHLFQRKQGELWRWHSYIVTKIVTKYILHEPEQIQILLEVMAFYAGQLLTTVEAFDRVFCFTFGPKSINYSKLGKLKKEKNLIKSLKKKSKTIKKVHINSKVN